MISDKVMPHIYILASCMENMILGDRDCAQTVAEDWHFTYNNLVVYKLFIQMTKFVHKIYLRPYTRPPLFPRNWHVPELDFLYSLHPA